MISPLTNRLVEGEDVIFDKVVSFDALSSRILTLPAILSQAPLSLSLSLSVSALSAKIRTRMCTCIVSVSYSSLGPSRDI